MRSPDRRSCCCSINSVTASGSSTIACGRSRPTATGCGASASFTTTGTRVKWAPGRLQLSSLTLLSRRALRRQLRTSRRVCSPCPSGFWRASLGLMTSSRHHVATRGIQRAMRAALRQAAISKPATPHSLRLYAESRLCRTRHRRDFFATHLLENGYGIRTVHELPGHAATTMIYAGVLKLGGRSVPSRLDALR